MFRHVCFGVRQDELVEQPLVLVLPVGAVRGHSQGYGCDAAFPSAMKAWLSLCVACI